MASRTGIVKVRITQRSDLAQGGTINFSVDDVSRSVITWRCKG